MRKSCTGLSSLTTTRSGEWAHQKVAKKRGLTRFEEYRSIAVVTSAIARGECVAPDSISEAACH